jgi:hypothetical protein
MNKTALNEWKTMMCNKTRYAGRSTDTVRYMLYGGKRHAHKSVLHKQR